MLNEAWLHNYFNLINCPCELYIYQFVHISMNYIVCTIMKNIVITTEFKKKMETRILIFLEKTYVWQGPWRLRVQSSISQCWFKLLLLSIFCFWRVRIKGSTAIIVVHCHGFCWHSLFGVEIKLYTFYVTRCGLVTAYGATDLSQHWFK